jgi:predicted adenine nucleotide alpha hydrolase (AANH) superfamily ATPase
MKVLLHICCGPCVIFPLKMLRQEGHEVNGLFYNPNIHPRLEYRKRLLTLMAYAEQQQLSVDHPEDYPMEKFMRNVVFREDERCLHCYEMRLDYTARNAAGMDCDCFTTTLLYSKYQKHDLIREIAEKAARKHGVVFLYRDFRVGWSEGVRLSKEHGMYRQPYCGCLYSENERFAERG